MAADVEVMGSRLDRRGALEQTLTERGLTVLMGRRVANVLPFRADVDAAVVVHVGYPSSTALRIIADSVERRPELGVVILGPLEPCLDVLVAVSSGAGAYLSFDSEPGAVADAIERVLMGEVVLPVEASRTLVQHLRVGGRGLTVRRPDGALAELTRREWEVLVLLRQGRTTAEIAERLVIANVTVRSHVLVVLRKLGLASRADLANAFGRILGSTRSELYPAAV
jgi:DNA-binding NarL/FixJ family response regulator